MKCAEAISLNGELWFVFLAPVNLRPYSLVEEHESSLEDGV